MEDADFAYAFFSREEAANHAGHAVADAWSELSQDLEDDAVLSLVAWTAVAAGAASEGRGQTVRKPVPETVSTQAARSTRGELCDFLVDAGARQPALEKVSWRRPPKAPTTMGLFTLGTKKWAVDWVTQIG